MPKINFSWTANSTYDHVLEYRIYEDTLVGRVLLASVPAPSPVTPPVPVTVQVEVPQGSHKFLIAAVNATGEGIISQPVTTLAFPPFGTPGIPSNFVAIPQP